MPGSRNSVRKIIRSKVTEFRYDRSAQPLPKLGQFTEQLDVILTANERCSRKERFTLTRIHDDLRRVGYDGSYASQRQDLMEIIEDRYEAKSTLITSQRPVDTWHEVIGEPTFADAILDRIVHNAYRQTRWTIHAENQNQNA